jgi:hypothetical protein
MPKGVDPRFWAVLTREERSYFEQMAALGPLTYGPRGHSGSDSRPAGAAALGSRLDVQA